MTLLTHCRRLAAPLIAALTLATGAAQADVILPTHIVQNGVLMGATGVTVNGKLYDVEFKDGSCNSLFNNCDDSLFAFRNETDAKAASQALFDLVFTGDWDTHPDKTNGCTNTGVCVVITNYARNHSSVLVESATNNADEPRDTTTFTWKPFGASTVDGFSTQAIWTLHQDSTTNNVPEPTSLGLMAAALGVLAGTRRRRARAA